MGQHAGAVGATGGWLGCFVEHWLHPSGVAVDVVEEHLILVAAAGTGMELACLVCVDGGLGLVNRDKNVMLL